MCKIPAINGKWHMYRAICGKTERKNMQNFAYFAKKSGKKVKDINDKDRYK